MTDPLSSGAMPRLYFDTSLIADALAGMPTEHTDVGLRPSLSKGALIASLAPIYLELGAMARALASSIAGSPVVPRFGSPFPWPIIKPDDDLVGVSMSSSTEAWCISLASGLILPTVPPKPILFVSLSNRELIDPIPYIPASSGRQAEPGSDTLALPDGEEVPDATNP